MTQLYFAARTEAGMDPAPKPVSDRSVDDSVAEVLDSDLELRKFHELRRKALRTSLEQQEYLAMISNRQLIASARAELLAAATLDSLDQGDELRRLQRIRFLNSALSWKDNPERTLAVDAASAVVIAEIPANASNDLKGSTLGDKFDLFQLLIMTDPEHAKALLARARGTSSEKILQFAWQAYWAGTSDPAPTL